MSFLGADTCGGQDEQGHRNINTRSPFLRVSSDYCAVTVPAPDTTYSKRHQMALGVETKPEASRLNGTLLCDKVSRKHSRKDKREGYQLMSEIFGT